MKKANLFLIPIVSASFLLNCGGSDPHIVNEEEFNKACSFEGVQYVQSDTTFYNGLTSHRELSPAVYFHIDKDKKGSIIKKTYIKKCDDGTYEKADFDATYSEYEFSPAEEKDFITPQKGGFNVLIKLQMIQQSYNSFTYNKTTGSYTVTIPNFETIILKFDNKILVSYYSNYAERPTTTTYTYSETTPDYPEKPEA